MTPEKRGELWIKIAERVRLKIEFDKLSPKILAVEFGVTEKTIETYINRYREELRG